MEKKPKIRGWKEGVITKDLTSMGGTVHKKGSIVRYKKFKSVDDDVLVSKYQYHYLDQSNHNLVRSHELLVDEDNS